LTNQDRHGGPEAATVFASNGRHHTAPCWTPEHIRRFHQEITGVPRRGGKSRPCRDGGGGEIVRFFASARRATALSNGRDDPFDHDFVNHIRLPSVFQFLARSIERPADAANCRIIENTNGNEPKNRQQVHATPRVYPAGLMRPNSAGRQRISDRSQAEHKADAAASEDQAQSRVGVEASAAGFLTGSFVQLRTRPETPQVHSDYAFYGSSLWLQGKRTAGKSAA
jgi:hypothetical protein